MSDERRPRLVPFGQAVDRHLSANALTRRTFLRRMAAVGGIVALGSVIEACFATATPSPSAAPSAAPTAAPTATPTVAPTATAAPSPIPSPEAELDVYNWDGYIADDTVAGFEQQYGIKVRYDNFVDQQTQIDTLHSDGRGGGYDVTYPPSTRVPSLVRDGIIRPIDHSLMPNLANLDATWLSPGYDAGNAHSVPNYWWTSGYAWDPAKLPKDYTTWADLWDPALKGHLAMLDDMREVFATAAFQLGLSPNTVDDGELDRILQKLEALKPLVRTWTDDDIGDFESGDVWLTQCRSVDWYQMTADVPDANYVIPEEGAIRGNDVMVILSGARHPIAAHLWINYNLDPQVSANNTNAIGYMGPNRAALPLIDDAIKGDPRLNPPASVQAKLQELVSLASADQEKYAKRWNLLRA